MKLRYNPYYSNVSIKLVQIPRTHLARCIPWNLQYCSALYQLACKMLTLTPFGHFGYILHLEKDAQVVFLLSQRGERHREPASCVATTGRVCAAWRKYDVNAMDVNTLTKFWMPFSFITIDEAALYCLSLKKRWCMGASYCMPGLYEGVCVALKYKRSKPIFTNI